MLNRLKDVFESFQRHKVKYVVIGGIASVLYGVPRATFDLDILIEATTDNARSLLEALLNAGLTTASLTSVEELLANEITIFKDRVRIDVQTSTPGLSFRDAWKSKITMHYQGQEFFVVSKQHLIASKRASGRDVDIARMFHGLPSRDRGEGRATGQPQGLESEAYLKSTSQGSRSEDARKTGHIRGRSRLFMKFSG